MIALLSIGALVLGVSWGGTYAMWKAAQRERRTHERNEKVWTIERTELINKIMFMADKPWDLPGPKWDDESVASTDPIIDPLQEPIDYDFFPNVESLGDVLT